MTWQPYHEAMFSPCFTSCACLMNTQYAKYTWAPVTGDVKRIHNDSNMEGGWRDRKYQMSIFAVSKRGFWVGLTGRFNEVREKIGRCVDVIDSRINTLTRGLFTFSHFLCTIKRLRSASQLWLIPGSLHCLPPFPLKVSRPVFISPHMCISGV